MKKLTTALVMMMTVLVRSVWLRQSEDIPPITHSICRLRRIRPPRKTSEPRSRYGNSNRRIIYGKGRSSTGRRRSKSAFTNTTGGRQTPVCL